MTIINEVHQQNTIGIKKLSDSDLGNSPTRNQTHIGLFEETLRFIDIDHHLIPSILIYDDKAIDVLSLLDPIKIQMVHLEAQKSERERNVN